MKFIKIISILIISSIFIYSQENPDGFQNIKFGTSYNVVKDYLIEKYHLIKYSKYMGYDEDYLSFKNDYTGDLSACFNSENKWIKIHPFSLGNRNVTVYLFFNDNLKFYKFCFNCKDHTANYFDTKVKEDAQYLSEIFEKKYGPPQYKYSPSFFEVSEGYYSYYWKWWRPRYTIFTAILTHEAEYYASAIVYDDILEKERQIIEEKNKKESIKSAVDAF